MQSVQSLFKRFAIQVALMVGDVVPDLSIGHIGNEYKQGPSHMFTIASIVDAREQLLDLIAYSMVNSRGDHVVDDERAVRLFQAWLEALQAFVSRQAHEANNSSDSRAFALLELQVRYLLLTVQMRMNRHGTEPERERSLSEEAEQLNTLIDLATRAHTPGPENSQKYKPTMRFHLDLGIVPILFSIAISSRSSHVSRRSVQLLLSINVQEGIWGSQLAGRVAHRMLELVSAGTADNDEQRNIAAAERISHIEVHFKPGKEAVISYKGCEGVGEELFVW
ncbi:hypothetical protein LIA77_05142 [Sarocladium implicatum]|nr:hypothetical protein LIA77_05142 [Sarocladium implicatum]